jgi:hypothetical protein
MTLFYKKLEHKIPPSKANFEKAVNELQGNLEAIKKAINSATMNIAIYDIRVNE